MAIMQSNRDKFSKTGKPARGRVNTVQKGPKHGMSELAYLRVNGTISITFIDDGKSISGKLIGWDAYNLFLQPKDKDYTIMIPKHSIKYCRMAQLKKPEEPKE
jgi:sRNA-binding regulator protein Hfq